MDSQTLPRSASMVGAPPRPKRSASLLRRPEGKPRWMRASDCPVHGVGLRRRRDRQGRARYDPRRDGASPLQVRHALYSDRQRKGTWGRTAARVLRRGEEERREIRRRREAAAARDATRHLERVEGDRHF